MGVTPSKTNTKSHPKRVLNQQPSSTTSSYLPNKGKAAINSSSQWNPTNAASKSVSSSSHIKQLGIPKQIGSTLHRDGNSYSARTSRYAPSVPYAPSVQIVDGWDNGCCVVDAMAGVTGGNYARAREVAKNHGFDPKRGGMFLDDARDALSDLGVKAVYHPEQPDSWSKLPRKAIVGVVSGGQPHAVILKGDHVYDDQRSRPVHRRNYNRMAGGYIEIK